MNNKKNHLKLLMMFLLNPTALITAMLSKPQSTQQERTYTQTQLSNQEVLNNLLFDECKKKNPDSAKVLSLIEDGADVNDKNAKSKNEWTPLHLACANKNFNLVELLIEHGANVESKSKGHITPLSIACLSEYFNIAKLLIEHGANIESKDKNERTLLDVACQSGQFNLVKFLVEHGANIESKNKYGETPLHLACEYGHLNIVKLLLKKGANVDAKTIEGFTPFHTAIWFGNIEICKSLLVANADINAKSVEGITPLDLAYEKQNNEILALFSQYGISIISQKQADENMRAFIAELNEEKLQKEQKKAIRQEKKHAKKIEPQKQAIQPKQVIKSNKQLTQTTPTQTTPQIPIKTETTEAFLPEPVETTSINTTLTTSTTSTTTPTASYSEPNPKTAHITSSSAQSKYLILIDKKVNARLLNDTIKDHIRQLKNWPYHGGLDVKKLAGKSNMYRLRVGGYRIIFSVDDANHEIKIHEIGLRKNIYKNLKL